MIGATLELLKRVKSLVEQEKEWFDTVCEWYKNVKLSRRLLEELRADDEVELLALKVNDRIGADSLIPQVNGEQVSWLIPASLLRTGENNLLVGLAVDAESPLFLAGVSVWQGDRQAEQKIDLTLPNPKPARYFELACTSEARHQARCWAVFPRGFLAFNLNLSSSAPLHFVLQLPPGRTLPWSKKRAGRRREMLDQVKDKVEKQVEKQIEEYEERWRDARKNGNADAKRLEGDIEDLRAYKHLHRKQIAMAVSGSASLTLEQVIQETGWPDQLIQQIAPPPVVKPAPAPARPSAPRPRGNPAVVQAPGVFGKLLFLTALAGAGFLGYDAWQTAGANLPNWPGINAVLPGKVASGDVIIALRKASDEIGWKRDTEKELSRAQIMAMVNAWGDLLDKNAPPLKLDDQAKLYLVGEKDPNVNAELGALLGIPIPPCRRMLIVYDLRNPDAARTMFEQSQENYRRAWRGDLVVKLGVKGEIAPLAVPGVDGAFAARESSPAGAHPTRSWARFGQYLFYTDDADALPVGTEIQDHQRRLTVLAAKMRQQLGK